MKESRISARTVYAGIVLLLALVVGLYFVYQIGQVALAFGLALLLAVVLGGPVDYLSGRGLPRLLGTLAVVGVLAGAAVLFALAVVPALIGQVSGLARNLPAFAEDDEDWVNRALGSLGLGERFSFDAEDLANAGREFLSGDALVSAAVGAGTTAVTVASLGLLVAAGSVFMVSGPRPLVDGFVSLFPAGSREGARSVLKKLYRTVQAWALGQLASMTFIAVSSAVALHLIGVPYALLLGLLGGLISFVPFLGSILSAVPPMLVALFTEPTDVLWVVLAYVVIQQVEGNVIQPVVMSRILKLPPVVVLFAIAVMGTLFGIAGVILAVPAAAVLRVLVDELWVGRMDERGEDPHGPRRQDEGDPMASIRQALGALRFWR